jgi:hypothetical protein
MEGARIATAPNSIPSGVVVSPLELSRRRCGTSASEGARTCRSQARIPNQAQQPGFEQCGPGCVQGETPDLDTLL